MAEGGWVGATGVVTGAQDQAAELGRAAAAAQGAETALEAELLVGPARQGEGVGKGGGGVVG